MTFIPANPAHTGGTIGTVDLVVIHATVSPCKTGGARANAAYFQTAGAGGAAHWVVDPAETVACIPETQVGYHAPPVNDRAIGVELCDPQTGPASRWADTNHTKMLTLAADLVAGICARHEIPAVYVDHTGLLAGRRGITTHHDVTLAWHKSTHTDPGPGFPMAAFIDAVTGPIQEDDMTPEQDTRLKHIEKLLEAFVAERRTDHKDVDPHAVSAADLLNAAEKNR